ncbi:hypothetical protein V6N11_019164 [Hibiscus sabdariffa]|uniref:Uncharacterized protein n=1 Tax=Hibiscus sabdariffa TaxID=183260 RepID=A0ABR2R1W2_9ROSI
MTENTLSRSSSSRSLISMNDSPFQTHKTNKIASLYEVDYYEEGKVQPTELPLVNSYLAYQKTSFSPLKSIKALMHTSPKSVKKYESFKLSSSEDVRRLRPIVERDDRRRWTEYCSKYAKPKRAHPLPKGALPFSYNNLDIISSQHYRSIDICWSKYSQFLL